MADLYQPTNSEELEQRFLRDVSLAAISVGNEEPPVGYGSDFWITSKAISGLCLMGFQNILLAESDQNILTATGAALDAHRIALGLPEVPASKGAGKLVVTVYGATTIPNGQAFLYPNGTSGKFLGTTINPSNNAELDVEATVTGTQGNLKAGQKVRLIGPPVNVATEATVSLNSPISGGTNSESDERKRERILNTLRNKPAGGNWAYIRDLILAANGGVQDVYIYPALGGPGSVKIVPVKDFDLENLDFSRAVPDTTLVSVRATIQRSLPVEVESVVVTSVDQPTDITLKFTIPESSQSGGSGQGWTDAAPWPPLVGGDNNRVTISSPSATFDSFTCSALTTVEPVDGQTHLAWWSKVERKFYTALIVDHSGSSGSWVVTLDRPLVDKTGAGPSTGDYVCPAAQNLEGYGVEWIEIFRKLGTGENLPSSSSRFKRAKRHPAPADEDPYSITNATLKSLVSKYPEITDYAIGYASSSAPTVPSNTATAPNILIPRNFAIYSL